MISFRSILLSVFLLLSLFPESLFSIGRVYARYPNNENSPIFNLRIKKLDARITIQDQLAITHVDQEFANDNNVRLEGFYIFRLPEGAQVNELYLWINGVRVPYSVKKKADAVQQYTDIVRRIADPAILQELGGNQFKLQIFPFDAHGTRRIEIIYSQPLTYTKGSIQYTFPLDMKDYTSSPIETVTMSFTIASQIPITGLETSVDQYPTAAQVTRVDSLHYNVVYGVENVAFSKDFFIRAGLAPSVSRMLVLTYSAPPSLNEDPYFLLWMSTPDTLVGQLSKPREITFVADISSSMEGLRLSQLKDALHSFIDLLNINDRFNIIVFSTGVSQFRNNLVFAGQSERDSAHLFVSNFSALGLTNFELALKTSLEQSYLDSLHSAIFFLTDGEPSWGETNGDSLTAQVLRRNTKGIPIHTIAVGDIPDQSILSRLAQQNDGLYTKINAEDSILVQIKDLYRKTLLPPLKNIAVNYGGLDPTDTHPLTLPVLHAGDQLMMAGRYSKIGSYNISFSGTVEGTAFSFDKRLSMATGDTTLPSIARYWGAQKIASVLGMIASTGEVKELVDQVIALSIRYSVLTPYTAFLVVEPTNPSPGSSAVQEGQNPRRFDLAQNFPNPFNPSTTIRYTIPDDVGQPIFVTIIIYDVLGRKVRTLVSQHLNAGSYQIQWDGTNDAGLALPSSAYFYRLQAGNYTLVKSMLLLK